MIKKGYPTVAMDWSFTELIIKLNILTLDLIEKN